MSVRSSSSSNAINARHSGKNDNGQANSAKRLALRRSLLAQHQYPQKLTPKLASELPAHSAPSSRRANSTSRSQNAIDTFKVALMARYGTGPGLNQGSKIRARSATNINAIAASQDHRDTEDVLDEILRLKRQMQTLNNENSVLKTKLRRMETELSKKNKELEEHLDQVHASNSNASGSSKIQQRLLTHSLKQKVVRLEQALRAKDDALNALKSDLKTTRLEELRVQSETMDHEILRLRHLKETQERPIDDRSLETQNRMDATQGTSLRLNEANQKLTEENKQLREKLNESAMVEAMPEDARKDAYAEMKRPQLLAIIRRLERELAAGNHCTYDTAGCSSKHNHNEAQSQPQAENNGFLETVGLLKDERTKLTQDLEEKEKEIASLKSEISGLTIKKNVKRRQQHADRNSKHVENDAGTATPVVQNAEYDKPDVEGRRAVEMPKMGTEDSSDQSVRVRKFRRNKAARTIQRRWKRHQEEREDALSIIDSAIYGHSNRVRSLTARKDIVSNTGLDASPAPSDGGMESQSVEENRPSQEEDSDEESISLVGVIDPDADKLSPTSRVESDQEPANGDEDYSSYGSSIQETSVSIAQARTDAGHRKIETQRGGDIHTRFRRSSVDDFFA